MNLRPLIAPRSIAIIGASERTALGRLMMEGIAKLGFDGSVWPVNPNYEAVLGQRCYPSIAELPDAPDVAAFCIGRSGVVAGLEDIARRGGRAAVVYDSGFAETGGDGLAMQRRLEEICKEASIALCGPNCMGVLNPVGKSSTFKQPIRTPEGLAGNVALISQSGSVAATLLADLRRFGFSTVVSSGNEAVVDLSNYIDYFAHDPATRVIACFIESVRNPARFVAALEAAYNNGKPVVVLKVGKNERTQHAITTHTGGLAGESRVFSEILRAHRAIEVADLDELTETLAACQGAKLPRGGGINVMTTSGGQAELILDVATANGITLTPLNRETFNRIERDVGAVTGDGNPLDAWGNGDVKRNMPLSLGALQQDDAADVIVFCSSDSTDAQPLGRPGRELDYARILGECAAASDKPHYMLTMRPGVMHTGQVSHLASTGVATICGVKQGLQAIDRLMKWSKPKPPTMLTTETPRLASGRRVINEVDAKRLVAAAGLPTAREVIATTLESAQAAANSIGYPIVLKVASDEIPHKSEHGLVMVGIRDATQLERAWSEMATRAQACGLANYDCVIQEYVTGGVEAFIGIARDPDFGHTIAFGMGGVGVEVLKDFSLRALPLREGDAREMIEGVRGAAILQAFRNKPASDIETLVTCIERLADFALANATHLEEIDINPIIVRESGQGCVIVDALIVTR